SSLLMLLNPQCWIGSAYSDEHAEAPQLTRLLRATCERPRGRGAAERDQQFPPSDGDCHTPLPCELRKGTNTTSPACRLYVQGAQDAAAHSLEPIARREKPIANKPIERA